MIIKMKIYIMYIRVFDNNYQKAEFRDDASGFICTNLVQSGLPFDRK